MMIITLPKYTIDSDGWWYQWNYRWGKYIALKKEYWPTHNESIKIEDNYCGKCGIKFDKE